MRNLLKRLTKKADSTQPEVNVKGKPETWEWHTRLSGHTTPDLHLLEPGMILKCRTEGHKDYRVAYVDVSDPGPYHAYGAESTTVRKVGIFDRDLKKRIAAGDFL